MGNVVIAGNWPTWVRDVTCVSVKRQRTKYEQTTANLLAALEHVGERFVLMNDDIFVMRSGPLEVMHRGPLEELRHRNRDYQQRMADLAEWLRAEGLPTLCYELHAPMVMERDAIADVLSLPAPQAAKHMHKRSLYGNVMGLGGSQVEDFKTTQAEDWPYLSTNESTFAQMPVGKLIRATFPEPSPYEELPSGDHRRLPPASHAPSYVNRDPRRDRRRLPRHEHVN